MLTKLEWIMVGSAVVVAAVLLVWIGHTQGWTSNTMAAWVQAVGTIGAVLLVTVPVIIQHRLNRRHSRVIVLAAAEMAYKVIHELVERYMNPELAGSEWWAPQWDVLRKVLADCPIQQTGSTEAFEAFVEFQQIVTRISAIDKEMINDNERLLENFVNVLMMNARLQHENLKAALGVIPDTQNI